MILFCTFVAFSLFIAVPSVEAIPDYTITEIVGGKTSNSYAYAINDKGEIVGREGRKAFYWRRGVFEYLEDRGAESVYQSYGLAINNRGVVVGGRRSSAELEGFYLNRSIAMSDMSVKGRSFAEVRDINEHNHALVVVDQKVYIHDLLNDKRLQIDIQFARALNNRGAMTGRGEVYDGKATRNLGDLGSRASTRANDINDQNIVVGFSDYRRGFCHAFIWRINSGMISLGTLGGEISAANAINNHNMVVGWSSTSDGQYRATLWDRKQNAIDLTTRISNRRGWRYLTEARDINEAGQIVGFGVTENGRERAFLLTPSAQ